MKYLVTISSKAEKAVKKMPMMEKARFKLLIEKLEIVTKYFMLLIM